jgi:hypothetical protein
MSESYNYELPTALSNSVMIVLVLYHGQTGELGDKNIRLESLALTFSFHYCHKKSLLTPTFTLQQMTKPETILPASLFGVTLVDAQTRQPFKEMRGPDGNTYVQIEPEREYFVEITASDWAPRFKAHVSVDGESLGYRYRSKDDGCCTKTLGLRSVKGGTNTLRALRFQRASSSAAGGGKYRGMHNNNSCDDSSNVHREAMTVHVTFHSVDDDWDYKENTWKVLDMNWNGANIEAAGSILSSPGTIETLGPKRSSRLFKTGALLGSMTLHYRTQEELIRILYPNINLNWSSSGGGSFSSSSYENELSRMPYRSRALTPTRRNGLGSRYNARIE